MSFCCTAQTALSRAGKDADLEAYLENQSCSTKEEFQNKKIEDFKSKVRKITLLLSSIETFDSY